MWLKSLFRINKRKVKNYSFLKTDIHNHILYGLDDGARSIEESLHLINGMANLGFTKLIPSPHIMNHLYPNNKETIDKPFIHVRKMIEEQKGGLKIPNYGAEYLIDEEFPNLRKNGLLIPFYKNFVLIEMSYLSKSILFEEEVYQLQMAGFQPVLAHPERYLYLHGIPNIYEKIVGSGCQLQLNLLSLTKRYSNGVTKVAKKILKDQLYHWAGSDVHKFEHIQGLNSLLHSDNINLISNYPFYNNLIITE